MPGVGGRGDAGGDAGHDLERDPVRRAGLRLLAAAAEDERVAALEAHDGLAGRARARRSRRSVSSCGTCSPPPILPTSISSASAPASRARVGGISLSWRITSASRDHLQRAHGHQARDRRARRRPGRRGRSSASSSSPAPRREQALGELLAERLWIARRMTRARRAASSMPSGVPTQAVQRRCRRGEVRADGRVAVRAERARRRRARRRQRAPRRGRSPSRAAARSPARACERDDALAGARARSRVERAPPPSSRPAAAARRRRARCASTSPSASLRSRVSTLPRSSTISTSGRARAQLRAPAQRRACRRARPGAQPASARARRAGPRAAGTATSTSPVGQRRRDVLGGVHRDVDARRRAAPPPARVTHLALSDRARSRSPVVVIVTISLAAERLGAPGAPARAPARCRACRAHHGAGAARSGRTLSAAGCVVGRRGALVQPEQLAHELQAAVAAIGQPCSWRTSAGSSARAAAAASTARAIASTRARSRGEADSQRPAFSASTESTMPVAVLAQRGDRRAHVELAHPAREALDLLLDDRRRPRRARPRGPDMLRATTACRSSMS